MAHAPPDRLGHAADRHHQRLWRTPRDAHTRYTETIPAGLHSHSETIHVQNPAGEQIEIASEAYLAGTLTQLRSTEVGDEAAEIVPLYEHMPAYLWNERVLRDVGVSYRLPPEWEERGADSAKRVRNFSFASPAGMLSLGDEEVSIDISAAYFKEDGEEILRQWIKNNPANEGSASEQPLPDFILREYDRLYYQVEGELITFANHPAVRLHSDMFPFAERIVVPLRGSILAINIAPRDTKVAALAEILASFALPSYEAEGSKPPTPTPNAPSPLATP